MRALDLILHKRAGGRIEKEAISFLIREYTAGKIPDEQMASFCMAVVCRGMDEEEAFHLTMAMADSGEKVSFSRACGFVADKHSTGGVGDKVSLVLIPMLAAAGLCVGKLSGRGLGHTGGTIDKLESIPGLRSAFSLRRFSQLVERSGLAIVESTHAIAPTDHKLYALRNATGTVESLALIVASIMSKKLAVQSDGLVLDVKTGSGAFMETIPEARRLARWLVRVAQRAGRKASALLTDMNQPLGRMVGNALELREAVETLRGHGPEDLLSLCLDLGSELVRMERRLDPHTAAKKRLLRTIEDGSAFAKLCEMTANQGGDPRFLDDLDRLPRAKKRVAVAAPRSGFIQTLDARRIGEAAHRLGAGRSKKDERIDHAVGVELTKKVGDSVRRGETLAWLHANSRERLHEAAETTRRAYRILENRKTPPPLIMGRVS